MHSKKTIMVGTCAAASLVLAHSEISFAVCEGAGCTQNPPPQVIVTVTPTANPSDVNEAKRIISMSEEHKFVDPLIAKKSGGLIQFYTPIKNKKIKTCS
mgnify:CR=1 FL=1